MEKEKSTESCIVSYERILIGANWRRGRGKYKGEGEIVLSLTSRQEGKNNQVGLFNQFILTTVSFSIVEFEAILKPYGYSVQEFFKKFNKVFMLRDVILTFDFNRHVFSEVKFVFPEDK